MKELDRKAIFARRIASVDAADTAAAADTARVQVGIARHYQREGDGGQFYAVVLFENMETMLASAITLGAVGVQLTFEEQQF